MLRDIEKKRARPGAVHDGQDHRHPLDELHVADGIAARPAGSLPAEQRLGRSGVRHAESPAHEPLVLLYPHLGHARYRLYLGIGDGVSMDTPSATPR